MDPHVREQVVRQIESFDDSVASLGHLVADLDAIWNSETWEDAARRTFRREWAKLEEIYATALDRRPRQLAEIDIERIHEVLREVPTLLPD